MTDWHFKIGYSTFNLFGELGTGDDPDPDRLIEVRKYIAAFRGEVIHSVTDLEDRISKAIEIHSAVNEVAAFAETLPHLNRDNFEKKKRLFKAMDTRFGIANLTTEQFASLDWLQTLRNDFAHGKEFLHSSLQYAEIRSRNTIYRLPDEQLRGRFEDVVHGLQDSLNLSRILSR